MIVGARKTYRIGIGIIFPLIYYFSPNKLAVSVVLAYLLGMMTVIEILRRIAPGSWKVMAEHSKGILKEEPGKLSGTTCFLIAAIISLICFSKHIMILALLFSIFGDAVSTIVGLRFGKIKFFRGKKSLEGTLAFFIICIIVGTLYLLLPQVKLFFTRQAFLIILYGAFASAFIEFIPIPVDDNLTIPIFSGIVMQIASNVI